LYGAEFAGPKNGESKRTEILKKAGLENDDLVRHISGPAFSRAHIFGRPT